MLTTTKAPFIEKARRDGRLFIEQPYELYSEENHEAWRRLYARMQPDWDRYANPWFLDGLSALGLDAGRVPRLEEVNRKLAPRTGFRARAVSGYVPSYLFFECLRNRDFPTTITVRALDSLDYLPEPDIFHDVAGHVPMHTDPHFAEALVRFGECAATAGSLAARLRGEERQMERLESILRGLARFFWFTIEFGLMRTSQGLRAYGSGLLSSHGELRHALESAEVQRSPLSLDWVIHQSFVIDRYQPLLFYVQGFEHLFELVDELDLWMRDGRLDRTAPGEPAIDRHELEAFLAAPALR